MIARMLAHQGGWDEILMVLTPISLFAGLLWLANRRANAHVAAPPTDPSVETDAPSEDGPTPQDEPPG